MSNTFKVGKEAMEFAKENGIIDNMKELKELKAKSRGDAVVINDFKYTFEDGNIVLEDISDKGRLPYPVRIIKRQGINSLRFTKHGAPLELNVIENANGCSWGQPMNPEAAKKWANGNATVESNAQGSQHPKGNEIIHVFTVKELPAPIVFSRRETATGMCVTVTIDLPFEVRDSERDLAYAVRSYCLALTKEASSGKDIEYIINKLFKEGFVYEDKRISSDVAKAYMEADLFCMKNNAELLSISEFKSVGFGNGGGWGYSSPTSDGKYYKNVYRLKLTLKEGN